MARFRPLSFTPCLLVIYWIAAAALPANAAQQGWGRVNMQGSIVDVPCVIAVDSREQTIDLSVLSAGSVIHDGQGPTSLFSIQLVNCTLPPQLPGHSDQARFRVTFVGDMTDGALFGSAGQAGGIGIQITDAAGNVAQSGVPMPTGELVSGDMRLDYRLRLVGTHQILRVGAYRTTVRFKMDYY